MKREETERMLDSILAGRDVIATSDKYAATACACGGSGFIHIEDAHGNRAVRECSCRGAARLDSKLARASIPERYRKDALDTFQAMGGHASLARGLATARRFVAEYPVGTEGRGLLFVGSVGIGKTHLAVGILRELVLLKGAAGMFVDFRDLLNQIKSTFADKSRSEDEVLQPIFRAEVLVLDELGAARVTDWSGDQVENIINTRYNDNKTTIITTNLPNQPPGGAAIADSGVDYGRAAAMVRGETLGDRIGLRMHSRLQQMCQVVEMAGEDYRAKKGKR